MRLALFRAFLCVLTVPGRDIWLRGYCPSTFFGGGGMGEVVEGQGRGLSSFTQ